MKRLLLIAAICVVAAPAFATDCFPITGMGGHLRLDVATGQITPVSDLDTRATGRPIWSLTDDTVFGIQNLNQLNLDCADVDYNVVFQTLSFEYATNSSDPVSAYVVVYTEEDNFDLDPVIRNIQMILDMDTLPGLYPGHTYTGWTFTAVLTNPVNLNGSDLDGDDLQDFGYGMVFYSLPQGISGQVAAGEPNVVYPMAPGADDGWSKYSGVDMLNDANLVTATYDGYYDWTNPIYLGQFYWELYAPGCPNAGQAGRYCEADIYGYDCLVNLNDLAQLLGNYGLTTGASHADGDVDPYDEFFPGDGDVDLGDLAELLGQYGDDCND
jgi:hypothetical protein